MKDYASEQRRNGSKGGKATLKRYGKDHMAKIGRKGGKNRQSKEEK